MFTKSSENSPDVVQSYLAYLQEMSRKISQRKGMENVLYGKTKTTPHYYCPLGNETDHYFRSVKSHLTKNTDRLLFLGNGLMVGCLQRQRTLKYIASSLIYAPVNIESDETTSLCDYSIQLESISINYDLITSLLGQDLDEENDDQFSEQSAGVDTKTLDILEKIEMNLQDESKIDMTNNELGKEIFNDLKNSFFSLSQVELLTEEFKLEYLPKNAMESGLKFYNHQFFYVASSPGQLSTYAALRRLIMEVG
jgi:hypothetical protein